MGRRGAGLVLLSGVFAADREDVGPSGTCLDL